MKPQYQGIEQHGKCTIYFTTKLGFIMDIRYFVGIDISKNTLDWAVFESNKVILQTNTPNSVAGIKTALRLLKNLPNWNPKQAIFCMEHTGVVRHEVARFEYG